MYTILYPPTLCSSGVTIPFLLLTDNCKKVALCFDDVISSVEVINSQGIQVQVSPFLGPSPSSSP